MTHSFGRLSALAVAASAALFTVSLVRPGGTEAASSAPALFTNAQANAGHTVYDSSCAMCHGAQLEGGAGPPLSGANMVTLGTHTHLKVGEMFQYITTNMPMNSPASLTHAQYVDVLAYILKYNGYRAGSMPLTYATASNSKVSVTSYK